MTHDRDAFDLAGYGLKLLEMSSEELRREEQRNDEMFERWREANHFNGCVAMFVLGVLSTINFMTFFICLYYGGFTAAAVNLSSCFFCSWIAWVVEE